jgi:phage-related protein
MATLVDSLCKTLSKQEGNLDIIEDDGTVKRYVATCVNFDELLADRQRYHLTLVPFTLKFVCKTPFARSRDYTSNYVALTASGNQSVVNGGTYKTNPVFGLVFSSASGVTAVEVENTTTGESITYTGSIAAGDVLVFDSELKRVLKNGVAQDYSGTFPKLNTGTNVVSYTVTGASFAADVTEKHKLTYLR